MTGDFGLLSFGDGAVTVMGWTIDYLKEDGIVLVKTSGPLTLEETRQLCKEAYSTAHSNGSHKFLADHRDQDITLSVLEIDKIPDMIKEIGVTSSDKFAILYHGTSRKIELLNFLRNLLQIEAIQMKIFSEPDKAIA